ncbi:hypothetical protein [Fictibacillus fluitans]|uniref:DUF4388 domain-containing protein n=1 Tax=Fictibacillus fluitans TaxID=3058422 RepID=A0ABT8HZC8_9BACL|nr:hypothetical protein [Fictibacillus sp. NE201]MDN4525815.1 hypothetical protein [Fictibacillus sp. NE201]
MKFCRLSSIRKGTPLSITLQGTPLPIVLTFIALKKSCLVGTGTDGSILIINKRDITAIQFLQFLPSGSLPVLPGLAALNSAQTIEQIQAALLDPALGLNLTNYNSLSDVQQRETATRLRAARPAAGFPDAASAQAELNRQAQAVNLDEVNAAPNAAAVRTSIERAALQLDLNRYSSDSLNDLQRTAVAQSIFAQREQQGPYQSAEAVQSALDAAIDEQLPPPETVVQTALPVISFLEMINYAHSTEELKEAIEHPSSDLDLSKYWILSELLQFSVLDTLLKIRPKKGFTTKEEAEIYLQAVIRKISQSE